MRKYFDKIMYNMRDIGGYPVKENGHVKYKKIIRSDAPYKIGTKEMNELLDMNISTIIDLRTQEEIEEKPTKLSQNKLFSYYNCNIKGGEKIPDKKELVVKSYLNMLKEKETMKRIFKIIAETKTGVLYYCNVGKDRTGVVTAILLLLLGVPEENIVEDYELSNTEIIKEYKQKCTKEIAEIITPKPEYMQKFLEEFKMQYNNSSEYLLSIGITQEEINQIKRKLIDKE